MPVIDHTHTYARCSWNPKMFRCLDKYCTHEIAKFRIIGKASLCCKCGKEITLTAEHLRRAKPACLACSNTRESRQINAVASEIASLFAVNTPPEEENNGKTTI